MIYIKLFLTFFKIGLFSFGGGYAMIPLIEKELESHNWMTSSQFYNIIAVSETTPGPISVNSATFVGYEVGGIFGSIVATMGVAAPSLILILIICKYLLKYQDNGIFKNAFSGIRPVVAGLIIAAAFFVAQTSVFKKSVTVSTIHDAAIHPFKYLNFKSILILVIVALMLEKFKLHPILVIFLSGVIGVVFFYII